MLDPLSVFFLICFLVGSGLSILSFVTGAAHISVPGGHALHVGHLGHLGHLAHAGHAGQSTAPGRGAEGVPLFNAGSLLAFLAWFGGIGYLLHTLSPLALLLVLFLSVLAGVLGAFLVLFFFVNVLLPAQTEMDPERYRLDGTQARVTASIRADATGEITYSKAGTRRSDAARSLDGQPIAHGTEVVIVSYNRGIAYVEPLERYLRSPATEMASRLEELSQQQEKERDR